MSKGGSDLRVHAHVGEGPVDGDDVGREQVELVDLELLLHLRFLSLGDHDSFAHLSGTIRRLWVQQR